MTNYRSRTIRAISWGMASQALSQFISLAFGIVLARLLVPSDFGLIAMVLVFIGFANLLAELGLGSALIQKVDAKQEHFSSVFWLNNLLGVILAVSIILLAPAIAAFYEQPTLKPIATALSLSFVLSALQLVPRVRLRKKLQYRELAMIDIVAMIFSGLVAIGMALNDFGYWSLVAQRLVSATASAILVWRVEQWLPSLDLSFKAARELIGFSSSVLLTRTIRYIAKEFDKLLIGKFLGAASLGLYDKAHSMMLFPLQNVSHVIGGVMFPSFSQIQGDPLRVRDVYLRLISAISLLTFPMMAGMFVVADSFVYGVLGDQWEDVIPLFRIFCIVGVLISIVTVTGSIYLSQGKANLQLRVNLVTQPLKILGVVIGLQWGLAGVAVAYAVTSSIGAFITWHVAGSLIQLRVLDILRRLFPAAALSLCMGVALWSSNILFLESTHILKFFLQVACGMVIYTILVLIAQPSAYRDIRKVLQDEFLKRKSDD